MRRQDIQLLAAARKGDIAARCEVGRRYLAGAAGFPRHVRMGLDYLTHPSISALPEAITTIVENLPLEDLIEFGQEQSLKTSASLGNAAAQLKLGIWQIVRQADAREGKQFLRAASKQGLQNAADALAISEASKGFTLNDFLVAAAGRTAFDIERVLALAAQRFLAERNLIGLVRCAAAALHIDPLPSEAMADIVLAAIALAEETGTDLDGIPPPVTQACLELKSSQGDYSAAFTLGRALCDIPFKGVRPSSLVSAKNVRQGAAMLLRAADGGRSDAWSLLYQIYSSRTTVSNAPMALFFLEKAAKTGDVKAQRQLGALILRKAQSIHHFEEGLSWLFKASRMEDGSAQELLASFVLPVQGSDIEADLAIEEVARKAPWLALRLRVSRDFGLTKLEALTVNLTEGVRSWGLVVGPNPYIVQRRLSGPRAIPALSEEILSRLRDARDHFSKVTVDSNNLEGDLRQRADARRYAMRKYKPIENMFFSKVDSLTLETFKKGPMWAARHEQLLAFALSEG